MSTHSPSSRAALRAFVVIALSAVVLGYSLPDIRRVWQPSGQFGVTTAFPDLTVTGLDPGSPAEKAGLKIGDRINVAATQPKYRYLVAYSACSPCTNLPGQELTMAVERDQHVRYIRMASEPEPLNTFTKTLIAGRELLLLLFLGIGAALVLLRPSVATWAFYFYCLGQNGAPNSIVPLLLDTPWNYLVNNFVETFLGEAGTVGIAVFAVLFLHEQSPGWRAVILRLVPFAFLVLVGLNIYVFFLVVGRFGWPAQTVLNLYKFLEDAVLVSALCAFIANYISARGTDRQRIRWVVFGFGIALAADVAITTIPALHTPHLYWLYSSLLFAPLVVPLTVAYAVVKHRIIDVSFVVSRTLVYGILTSLLVGAFALIDWLFIDKLKLARLGAVAEMGVAVAGGFWFNGLHRRVDLLIDATFFRQRHIAERQLARIAAALPYATTTKAVAQSLVAEPVRSLALASAALFRRSPDGTYAREESVGWGATEITKLNDEDDHFLMLLRAENGPVSHFDHPWRTEGVPSGAAHPVLALPIIVRRELTAVVFYGAHTHGEALDPDEISAIADLATGAAVAYDHLEAELLRRENEALRTRLAEAQIQPA